MDVYRLISDAGPVAEWIRQLLEPACKAVRISCPRGIELRPIGMWDGLSPGPRSSNASGRISISPRALLYSRPALVKLYVHEQAHALLEEIPTDRSHEHNAAFFCLNLAMLLRLDRCKYLEEERVSAWCASMQLYDLQDPPACWTQADPATWIPRALAWAAPLADRLADSDLDAKAMALEISRDYRDQERLWDQEPVEKLRVDRELRRLRGALADAQQQAYLRAWLSGIGFVGMVTCALLAVTA